jgi:hypothetical protein
MFHLRNAQMHLNAAISDSSFKRKRCPKDFMGLDCLREAYNKIEERAVCSG